MCFPIGQVYAPDRIPAHHDFSSTRNRWAVLIADITNYALVPAYALNFVRIIDGQKLDAAVVDGEPNLDFYQLARLPVRGEPLFVALNGTF